MTHQTMASEEKAAIDDHVLNGWIENDLPQILKTTEPLIKTSAIGNVFFLAQKKRIGPWVAVGILAAIFESMTPEERAMTARVALINLVVKVNT